MKYAYQIAFAIIGIILVMGGTDYAQKIQNGADYGHFIIVLVGFVAIVIEAWKAPQETKTKNFLGITTAEISIVLFLFLSLTSLIFIATGYKALYHWITSDLNDKSQLIKTAIFFFISLTINDITQKFKNSKKGEPLWKSQKMLNQKGSRSSS